MLFTKPVCPLQLLGRYRDFLTSSWATITSGRYHWTFLPLFRCTCTTFSSHFFLFLSLLGVIHSLTLFAYSLIVFSLNCVTFLSPVSHLSICLCLPHSVDAANEWKSNWGADRGSAEGLHSFESARTQAQPSAWARHRYPRMDAS